MLPDRADRLTTLDVDDAKVAATRAGLMAVSAVNRILRQTNTMALLVEGEIESPEQQNRALHIAAANESDALAIADALQELVAQHTALLAMVEVLIQQRDRAMQGDDQFYDELIERVAEIQGCSKAQAYKLIATLTNTDEDLLEADVVIGADRLDHFRDELYTLIDVLSDETDDFEVEEEEGN